ncbi:septum formation family protein [Rhodococcus sovatensis]|uniref:Septum formation family protein n=2 Tax=Rhodococcus sovatensis TaxID=1805840 RepID=A0ABZ2PFE8_9NOCA
MSPSDPNEREPKEREQRTVTAHVARRVLALVAVGAVAAAAVTLFVSDGFSQPEKITTHSEAGPATSGPVTGKTFGAADPGTCLDWTPTDDPATDRQDLTEVSCADPHRFEVAKDVDMTAYPGLEFAPGSAYPGALRFGELRDEHCVDVVDDYLGTKFDPNGKFSVGLMFPSQTGWAAGERTLRCGIQQSSNTGVPQQMTGSVLDQDQSKVWDVGTCIGINQNVPADPVDCSQSHAFEVTSIIDLQQQFPTGIPSEADQDAYLEPTCTAAVNGYLGSETALRDKTLTLFWSTIDVTSWLAGSRQVSCSIGKELDEGGFATITGSAKGDILINGQPPAPPPAAPDGRALPTPLPGAAPITPGG